MICTLRRFGAYAFGIIYCENSESAERSIARLKSEVRSSVRGCCLNDSTMLAELCDSSDLSDFYKDCAYIYKDCAYIYKDCAYIYKDCV